ncbi:MAG: hypothetical protein U7127_20725 [Phormidium sp.]
MLISYITLVKSALVMRMTGITTGVGLPHNIGHSNAWKNYSVTEVNEYKSRQYGSKGNKYRFTVTGGNQLMYVPDKGQSFTIAKIRCETYKDGVTHYYLEWLKTANQLTQQQRQNAERCIKPETVRKSGDTNINSNVVSVRDNSMLYGVVQAEMRERGDSVVVLPATKTPKPEYYKGRVFTFTSRNQADYKKKELIKLGISFTRLDKYTLVID